MKVAVVAVFALLGAVAPAQAATYCVEETEPGCIAKASVAAAFEAAADEPGTDTIRIGRHSEQGTFDDDGGGVRIAGAGRAATVLSGRVDLGDDASALSGLTVRGTLALRGVGDDLSAEGDVRLRDGAELRSSVVTGALTVAGGVTVHSVLVTGPGLTVESGQLSARNLTVAGTLRGAAALTDSIVAGAVSGAVTATRSLLPGTDPRLLANLSPGPGSPAVDAGDPEALSATEPQIDAVGEVRAMDGNGNGTARRDIGALERRPPPPPSTAGNLLANPGAEQGTAATDDRASPAPPHWTRTGAFTSVRYGTVAGVFAFPSLDAAAALSAGHAFFAAGPSGAASLRQVVDMSRWAPEIDARSGAAVRLSALLGGFRASDDHATVMAHFRGPFGARARRDRARHRERRAARARDDAVGAAEARARAAAHAVDRRHRACGQARRHLQRRVRRRRRARAADPDAARPRGTAPARPPRLRGRRRPVTARGGRPPAPRSRADRVPERRVRPLQRRGDARPQPHGGPRRPPFRAAAGPDPPPAHLLVAARAPLAAPPHARPRLHRGARRARPHPHAHGAGPYLPPLMLLVVDVGNTQTHIGTFRREELRRALAASPRSAARPPTSSAPPCARCSACAG